MAGRLFIDCVLFVFNIVFQFVEPAGEFVDKVAAAVGLRRKPVRQDIPGVAVGSSSTSWIFKPVSALIRSTVALSVATLATSMGLSMYFRTECRALIASISSMSLIYTISGTWQSPTPQSPAAGQVRLPGSPSSYNLDNLSTKWTF